MTKQEGLWFCTECDYSTKKSSNLYEHIESRHCPTSGYTCVVCAKFCPTRNAMRNHNVRYHQTSKVWMLLDFTFYIFFHSPWCPCKLKNVEAGWEHALTVIIHPRTILMYMSILRASMYLVLATFVCFAIKFVQPEKHWDVTSIETTMMLYFCKDFFNKNSMI